jgi:hypothetical protein
MIMEEAKRKRIEAKLRRMIALQDWSKNEKGPAKGTPPGTRVIRRRKGSPDKHII